MQLQPQLQIARSIQQPRSGGLIENVGPYLGMLGGCSKLNPAFS
jgi:hypothetical protein